MPDHVIVNHIILVLLYIECHIQIIVRYFAQLFSLFQLNQVIAIVH